MPKAGGYTKKGKKDRKKQMDYAGTWVRGSDKYEKPASGKHDKNKY